MALAAAKQSKVDSFRSWLINNDVQFTEHANGHFQVFNPKGKIGDVWSTTEKAIFAGETTMGTHSIKRYIKDHVE